MAKNSIDMTEIAIDHAANAHHSNMHAKFAMAVAKYITGEKHIGMKIKGDKEALLLLAHALMESKNLYCMLINRHTVDDFQFNRLKERVAKSIKAFEDFSHIEWPI
ncbi:MAG: hypothetical protein Q7K43_05555 [Candidatus Woesearchaeota archaeon]|nr:hypothetical protein [Candidatus Woesearchaeota archaeon]